jgi:hypothetical protein
MSSITCTSCGAEIVAGSRFCRRCGQPAPAVAARDNSVLEAETRVFATPTDYATPTQHINSPLTGPAYIAPGQPAAPPAAATKPLKPSGSAVKWVFIGLFLLILLMIPISFAVVHMLKSQTGQPQPPVITAPEIPPPPPPPTGRGVSTPAIDTLIYPGAELVMNVSGQGESHEGRVLQLRTRDPFDKVVDWYVEKLKPNSNMVKVPGDVMTILRGEGVNVVITTKGDQTEIIINQGSD